MYRERKIYFGCLFSIFILFAILILMKKPIYLSEKDQYVWLLLPFTVIPAVLLFLKKASIKTKILIAYTPAVAGFLTSLTLNNSIYFLASFPIFLVNFLIILPKDGR